MKNLINLTSINDEMRISASSFSENMGTTYKSAMNLIKTHKTKLEIFGQLPFKKDATGQKVPAYLNEDQTIFLITLSKNTERVVDAKHDFVKAFSMLRKKQAIIDANHASVEWQQNRELGKLTHRKETDVIKTFVAYAGAQGSNNYPKHGYSLITKMINSALSIEDRDAIDEDTLHLLSTAESIAENAITQGMNENLPYKIIFQQAKANVNTFVALAIPFELEMQS